MMMMTMMTTWPQLCVRVETRHTLREVLLMMVERVMNHDHSHRHTSLVVSEVHPVHVHTHDVDDVLLVCVCDVLEMVWVVVARNVLHSLHLLQSSYCQWTMMMMMMMMMLCTF